MQHSKRDTDATHEPKKLVSMDLLDETAVIVGFSDGSAAKVDAQKLARFIVENADEIVSGEVPDMS